MVGTSDNFRFPSFGEANLHQGTVSERVKTTEGVGEFSGDADRTSGSDAVTTCGATGSASGSVSRRSVLRTW